MFGGFIEKIKNIFREEEDEIEPNISKLPKKIGKYEVKLQFMPPKWLSPSEVWFLYYRKFQDTNLDAMLYEWAYMKYVLIENDTDSIVVTKLKQLKSDKSYECKCWSLLFWGGKISKQTMYFKNEDFNSDYNRILISLAEYCKNNWWLDYKLKVEEPFLIPIPISIYHFLLTPFILCLWIWLFWYLTTLSQNAFWIQAYLWIFACIFIYNSIVKTNNYVNNKFENKIRKIKLTDEWNKILAHIYWYKYFLEKCDEEKYIKLCKNDKNFIDKTLPYIIALRLNSCFLNKFSVLHFENMKVIAISK